MIRLLTLASEAAEPVYLRTRTYPDQRAEVVILSVRWDGGTMTWESDPQAPGAADRVASLARMMGVEVFTC